MAAPRSRLIYFGFLIFSGTRTQDEHLENAADAETTRHLASPSPLQRQGIFCQLCKRKPSVTTQQNEDAYSNTRTGSAGDREHRVARASCLPARHHALWHRTGPELLWPHARHQRASAAVAGTACEVGFPLGCCRNRWQSREPWHGNRCVEPKRRREAGHAELQRQRRSVVCTGCFVWK